MNEIKDILEGLSLEEQKAVLQILKEQQISGSSQSLVDIVSEDYTEMPVSVKEFIENPRYAGNYLQNMYPYWKNQLIEIFDKGKHYSEVALTGSIGVGKAQPLSSQLLGPDGYFKMRDAKVGMKVMGEDGKIHTIVKVWPQGKQKVYRITFSDHTYAECEEDHLWNIRQAGIDLKGRRFLLSEGDFWQTVSLRWLLNQNLIIGEGKKDKNGHSIQQRRFYIPTTKPLEFPNDKELPIHPYIFGQIIGDGGVTCGNCTISVYEEDNWRKIDGLLKKHHNCKLKLSSEFSDCKAGDSIVVDIETGSAVNNEVYQALKSMNFLEKSINKYIPKEYLFTSSKNRIQLLQGIFDSDGSITGGGYTYSTSSEQLYNDIVFLIESLGGSVFLTHPQDSWYTKDDERVYTPNKHWEFWFKLPENIKPYTSKKHAERFGKGTAFRKNVYRFIDKIEYVRDEECQCITTDNDTGLYLTDHCIVTHNSSIAIVAIAYELYKLMCLKNPQKYWGTNKTIFVAFFNNNLELAKSVGFSAMHDLIRKSEWFLEHGEFRGRVNQVYHPNKDIQLMAGSLPNHIIGKDVFCITGNTKILTNSSVKTAAELANSSAGLLLPQLDLKGSTHLSQPCAVVYTKDTGRLIRITLDNDDIIEVTPEHRLMISLGVYSESQYLFSGSKLYDPITGVFNTIKSVDTIELDNPVPVYDVINAYPYNNFIIVTDKNKHVVSHNCALQDEVNFCLDENTQVLTKLGCKAIKDITEDDIIYNYFDGKLIETKSAGAKPTKYVRSYIEIILEDNTILKCSYNHKFMFQGGYYKEAKDVHSEDYLCSPSFTNNSYVKVCYSRIVDESKQLYDIIDSGDHHNFIVVTDSGKYIVSHNSAGANVHLEQNKIMQTYNSIQERIASRFTRDGKNWGSIYLVSSKKSEYDFLESYIRKQKGKPHFYVADAKIWDVKPMGVYSGKKFNLAVGGSNLPSKIIPDEEDPIAYEKQGYDVIQVPIEHKQSFELDMQSAIMNVAGISISHVLKFMNIEQIKKCYTDDVNPFVEEIIPIGLNNDLLLQDFFNPAAVPEEIYSRPIFIHLDMAVSGDNAGIGAVAAMGFVNTSEYNLDLGKVVETRKMAYRHVFSVGVSAPKNDEIHFAKIREFLYYLKFNLGWNIRGISADGFNCLTEDNEVMTDSGNKKIIDLDASKDLVLAYDIKSHRYKFSKFIPVRQSGSAKHIIKITLLDNSYIKCTPHHLIYVVDKKNVLCGKYKQAKDLTTDDVLFTRGNYGHIKDVSHIHLDDKVPVYDIEVPDYENFVLSNGAVVHNSVDMRQQLSTMGFNDVSLVSLDRTSDGYMALKLAIAEKRISLLHLDHLEVELAQLERDNVTGKIDHPLTGCFTGDTKVRLTTGEDITLKELAYNIPKDAKVWTVNAKTGVAEKKRILKAFETKQSEVIELTFITGVRTRCTADHRFLLRDLTYKAASELTYDDELFTGMRVTSIKSVDGIYSVYDLTIEDNPNFLLSCGVVVHNSKDEADGLAGALYNALLHEKELANDMSYLVESLIDANDAAPITRKAEVKKVVDTPAKPLTKEEIIAEAKRRVDLKYSGDYVEEKDDYFDPREGILI